MQIILHTGFHKTGSTYIQNLLDQNRDNIPARIGLFHQADRSSQELHLSCLAYDHALRANQADAASEHVAAIHAACQAILASASPDQDTLLISDEEISGCMPGRLGTRRIYASIDAIGDALVAGFAPHPVRFVMYRRAEPKWLASVHNQAVKQHRLRVPFNQFEAWLKDPVDLDPVIARLEAAVGADRLDIVSFEEDAKRETGLGSALLERAGLTEAEIAGLRVEGLYQNESLHPLALELMLDFNKTDLKGPDLRKVARLLLARREWFEGLR